ncbi:protein disabled-like [Limulus polyphemus]|uniref:Protein disabled-like n=1 Tax=Limulus polyphemus TaxID=6850 RepID=A0ABM1S8M1_LIMPO|nr:protein disabled-like [Limulus polyphemus]
MKESDIMEKDLDENSIKEDGVSTTSSETKDQGSDKKSKDLAEKKKIKKETKTQKEAKAGQKMKQVKKEKTDISKFQGDGIQFKAKLIGQEDVNEARGDKMCQESLQRLKAIVRSSGEHKHRITLNVSLAGIRIKDEKTNEELHHHPVHTVSFISQDISDARAFGYICNVDNQYHKFIAIKTEKSASQVVIALRDLFQVILESKQKEMEKAKQEQQDKQKSEEENVDSIADNSPNGVDEPDIPCSAKEENIYSDIKQTTRPETVQSENSSIQKPEETTLKDSVDVGNLLDLQFELNSLQLGIQQMDSSIAATATAFDSTGDTPENDPFTSAFVLTPQKVDFIASKTKDDLETTQLASRISSTSDLDIPPALPPRTRTAPTSSEPTFSQISFNELKSEADKYAAFSQIDSIPSIFDNPDIVKVDLPSKETSQLDISFAKTDNENSSAIVEPPPKPSRSIDLSVFAELDPLGRDRPFIEKKNFFHELKNPPKKVLKDLLGDSTEASQETVSAKPDPPLSADQVSSLYGSPSKQFTGVSGTTPPGFMSPKLRASNPFICDSAPPPPPPPRIPARASEPSFNVIPSPPPKLPHRNCVTPTPPPPPRKIPPHPLQDSNENQLSKYSLDSSVHESPSKSNSSPVASPPIPIPSRKPPSFPLSTSPFSAFTENDSPHTTERKTGLLLVGSTNSFDFGTHSKEEHSVSINQGNSVARPRPSGHTNTLGSSPTKLRTPTRENASISPKNVTKRNPFVKSQTVSFWSGSDGSEDTTTRKRDGILPVSLPSPSASHGYQKGPSSFMANGTSFWGQEKDFFLDSFSTSQERADLLISYLKPSQLPINTNDSQTTLSFCSNSTEGSANGNQLKQPVSTPYTPEENNIFRRKFDPFADDFFQTDISQSEQNPAEQESEKHVSVIGDPQTHSNGWTSPKEPVYSKINKVNKEEGT